jgi:hypothetical protein
LPIAKVFCPDLEVVAFADRNRPQLAGGRVDLQQRQVVVRRRADDLRVVRLLLPVQRILALEAFCTRWKLVTMCPAESQINPEPVPAGRSSTLRRLRSSACREVVMKTTDGDSR